MLSSPPLPPLPVVLHAERRSVARDTGIGAETRGGKGEKLLRRCDECKQAQRRSKGRVHMFARRATPADGLMRTWRRPRPPPPPHLSRHGRAGERT